MLILLLNLCICLIQAQVQSGQMTMWSTDPNVIVASMCEYANAARGGRSAPSAVAPPIQNLHYCAANVAILGAVCGNCYEVEYDGSPATDPGRAGSAIVQIVDRTADGSPVFDCQSNVFNIITGANTGVFPITYKQVDCPVATGGPRAMVIDGSYNNNGNNVKVIFANLLQTVVGAKMSVSTVSDGSIREFTFSRSGNSAVWRGNGFGDYGTNIPAGGATTFTLTMQGGSTVTLENCFSSWPKAGGEWCQVGGVDGTRSPTLSPTMHPTRHPTHAPTFHPTRPTLSPTMHPTLNPVENCHDIADQSTCESYNAEWNMCAQEGNWWRTQCQKTCGLCAPQEAQACSDNIAECAEHAQTWDVCASSWWKSQCRKTCGAC